MQKIGYKLKFGSWIEFAQLDKFLKIKTCLLFMQIWNVKIMTTLCNIFDSAWSKPWTWFFW